MVFENVGSKMNNILNCKKCSKKLDVPKLLPCGSTICSYCSLIQPIHDKFKCPVCKEYHWFPKEGLPTNCALLDLLSFNSPEEIVKNGDELDILKNNLANIHRHIEILSDGIQNGTDQITRHCNHLKSEVQLASDSTIEQINEIRDVFFKKIDDYEKNCYKAFNDNHRQQEFKKQTENEFNKTIEKMKAFYSAWNNFLKSHKVDYHIVIKANEHAYKLLQKAERNTIKLDNFIFNDNLLIFNRYIYQFGETILGELSTGPINIKSNILTNEQMEELMILCKFPYNQKWELLYSASTDGFEASDFHSKCDHKSNTLIIIKASNGNIFGGYTEQDWSGNSGYKNDGNAFIFSLVNSDKWPLLMKCEFPNHAIYCNEDYGPTFGAGHDFHISPNSNASHKSYSNPSSYSIPNESFLAGSNRFKTTEIEIYCK